MTRRRRSAEVALHGSPIGVEDGEAFIQQGVKLLQQFLQLFRILSSAVFKDFAEMFTCCNHACIVNRSITILVFGTQTAPGREQAIEYCTRLALQRSKMHGVRGSRDAVVEVVDDRWREGPKAVDRRNRRHIGAHVGTHKRQRC